MDCSPPNTMDRQFGTAHSSGLWYVPYSASKIADLLAAWRVDGSERKGCTSKSSRSSKTQERLIKAGCNKDDPKLLQVVQWLNDSRRFAHRHRVVEALNAKLPLAETEGPYAGARIACETYSSRAGGDARLYPVTDTWTDERGKPRSATLPGTPNEVRTALVGQWLGDKDGAKSDPTIWVIAAYRLGIAYKVVKELCDYLKDPEKCYK